MTCQAPIRSLRAFPFIWSDLVHSSSSIHSTPGCRTRWVDGWLAHVGKPPQGHRPNAIEGGFMPIHTYGSLFILSVYISYRSVNTRRYRIVCASTAHLRCRPHYLLAGLSNIRMGGRMDGWARSCLYSMISNSQRRQPRLLLSELVASWWLGGVRMVVEQWWVRGIRSGTAACR